MGLFYHPCDVIFKSKFKHKFIIYYIKIFVLVILFLLFATSIFPAKKIKKEKVSSPKISHSSGTYYKELKIEIKSKTKNAKIYYTIDGKPPLNKGGQPHRKAKLYKNPVLINKSCKLKCVAFKKGSKASKTVTAEYTLKMPSLAFSLDKTEYYNEQKLEIKLKHVEKNKISRYSIFYTTDGSEPAHKNGKSLENTKLYKDKIEIDKTTTVKAVAYKKAWEQSQIISKEFVIKISPVDFSHKAGEHFKGIDLELTGKTKNAKIFYTTNGSEPEHHNGKPKGNTKIYNEKIKVYETKTIKAFSWKKGLGASETTEKKFVINKIAGKKIFILQFIKKKNSEDYAFGKSVPRSIRSVLRKNNKVKYSSKSMSNQKLLKRKFQFIIKGKYIVRKGKMRVQFSVVHLKKDKPVLIAIANGYPDYRMFRLIDSIAGLVNKQLNKKIKILLSRVLILTIDPKGKIKRSNRNSLDGFDLSDLNLKGIKLTRRNLSNINFHNSDLTDANLSHSNVRGVNFSGIKYDGMKSMKSCLNFTEAKGISMGMLNQVYVHDFFITAGLGFGASEIYSSSAYNVELSQLGLTTEANHGFSFKVKAGVWWFMHEYFGLFAYASFEHNILIEKIPAYQSVSAHDEYYKINYLIINAAGALRLSNFTFFVGFFMGFPLGFNKDEDEFYSIRTTLGLGAGLGYKFRLSMKTYIYVGFEYKLHFLKWGSSDKFEDGTGGSKFMTFYLDVSFLLGLF